MGNLGWKWLLIFVLIVQSISQNSAVLGMYHSEISGQSVELIVSHEKNGTQENMTETAGSSKAHCHDEMTSVPESNIAPTSDVSEPQNPDCVCCDDSCTMARCPTLFCGLASQLEMPIIEGSVELPINRVQQLVNRMRKPPTPPPNLAYS